MIRNVIIGILIISIIGIGYFFTHQKPTINPIIPGRTDDSTFCTADAKQCSDGSYVGRSGPKCEFTECPKTTSSIKKNPPEPGTPTLE